MWKWIKKLFSSKPKKENLDYPKMSKGDLKRLKAQGIIKSIYKPYN
jgi:hypothetical protein